MNALPFWPPAASAYAETLDRLVISFSALIIALAFPVFVLIFVFAIRYRRGRKADRKARENSNLLVEISWSVIPFVLTLFFFVRASVLYAQQSRPPADALTIDVVGKQWMWKFQHPNGVREVNALHVPVGRSIRLIMTSQDVIHSMYVPAFRIKQDVVPGRYTQTWFQATKPGKYHLFCAEYCGTQHSGMIGTVIVMDPVEYQQWLSGGVPGETMTSAGQRLFEQNGCVTCHMAGAASRAPQLEGLFGKTVALNNGQTVTADETYIRESILLPQNKIVAGFDPIMPTFQGRLSEDEVNQLVSYVKSLAGGNGTGAGTSSSTSGGTATQTSAKR